MHEATIRTKQELRPGQHLGHNRQFETIYLIHQHDNILFNQLVAHRQTIVRAE